MPDAETAAVRSVVDAVEEAGASHTEVFGEQLLARVPAGNVVERFRPAGR